MGHSGGSGPELEEELVGEQRRPEGHAEAVDRSEQRVHRAGRGLLPCAAPAEGQRAFWPAVPCALIVGMAMPESEYGSSAIANRSPVGAIPMQATPIAPQVKLKIIVRRSPKRLTA